MLCGLLIITYPPNTIRSAVRMQQFIILGIQTLLVISLLIFADMVLFFHLKKIFSFGEVRKKSLLFSEPRMRFCYSRNPFVDYCSVRVLLSFNFSLKVELDRIHNMSICKSQSTLRFLSLYIT